MRCPKLPLLFDIMGGIVKFLTLSLVLGWCRGWVNTSSLQENPQDLRGNIKSNELSLRGSVSIANTTKQSTINANKYANLNDLIDSWICKCGFGSFKDSQWQSSGRLLCLAKGKISQWWEYWGFYPPPLIPLRNGWGKRGKKQKLAMTKQNANSANLRQIVIAIVMKSRKAI